MKTHTRNLFIIGVLMALAMFTASLTPAKAFLGISIGIAPPALPVYAQPECPGDGYIWTPGYWAWDASYNDYYWVPGTWIVAPEVGYLWTPAWWGCNDGAYFFHAGYWGPSVGFYGGINYGYGYNGRGYYGGYWNHNHFYYNREVNNVRGSRYAYARAVENGNSRVSFNGPGGINARATAAQEQAARQHHIAATTAQNVHLRAAAADTSLRYSANHGHPAVTATSRPGEIRATDKAAVASRADTEQRATAAESHRPAESAFTGQSRPATESHVAASDTHRAATASAYHATEERSVATRSASAYRAPASHEAVREPTFHSAAHAPAIHAAAPRAGGGGGRAPAGHAAAPGDRR
jgi:hypothetical protein